VGYTFVAGASGREGHIAIGAQSGEVRLYTNAGKERALRKIENLTPMSPVLALDISPDEQWMVATQQQVVSVVTFLPDAAVRSPFVAKGEHDVQQLSLTLSDWDLVRERAGRPSSPFANAKFVSRDDRPVAIVASVGPAIVRWALADGKWQPQYHIEFIDSGIIVDHMPLNDSGDVIRLTQSDIRIVHLPA
jgi:hypothetical protein